MNQYKLIKEQWDKTIKEFQKYDDKVININGSGNFPPIDEPEEEGKGSSNIHFSFYSPYYDDNNKSQMLVKQGIVDYMAFIDDNEKAIEYFNEQRFLTIPYTMSKNYMHRVENFEGLINCLYDKSYSQIKKGSTESTYPAIEKWSQYKDRLQEDFNKYDVCYVTQVSPSNYPVIFMSCDNEDLISESAMEELKKRIVG